MILNGSKNLTNTLYVYTTSTGDLQFILFYFIFLMDPMTSIVHQFSSKRLSLCLQHSNYGDMKIFIHALMDIQ